MYRTALKLSIIFLYLIIIAGAVVRMTGSGMGCPDWPKCFGYLVPPTEKSELQFKPNHEYNEGEVIIIDKSLRVVKSNFKSTHNYDEKNWSTYDKHDYADFNVWHTWIEYINRLVTAFAGIPMLLMVILSFKYWKRKRWLIFGSFSILPLMLFQAWLGKLVVDSNLLPVKITIHMIAALVILAILLILWFKTEQNECQHIALLKPKKYSSLFSKLIFVAFVFTLIQTAFGTQVRQYIDMRIIEVGYDAKALWLDPPTLMFYIHRSFSILITVLSVYLYLYNKKRALGHHILLNYMLLCIGLEVLTGILMYYVDFPFTSQPLHLVIASLLFGVQFYIWLESTTKNPKDITQNI